MLLGCRNAEKAAVALDAVKAAATGAPPEVVPIDLADLFSVKDAAEQIDGMVDRLDILMNNAGVMAIPLTRTPQGYEMQFGTNHLGHFALTGRLLRALLRANLPRVVTTSSQAHRIGKMRWDDLNWEKGYKKWARYGQSKLANLLFMRELHRQAEANETSLLSAAAHPGYAATHLQSVGSEISGKKLAGRVMALGNRVFAQTDAMGALPQLYVATMPDVKGGDYWGPDGLFENRGHPERVKSTKRSQSAEDAARLWAKSEELTGVTYAWS